MTRALITGISGQDGKYLCELLLKKNYQVIGTTRDAKTATSYLGLDMAGKIDLIEPNYHSQESIEQLFEKYRPQEVYNLAASARGDQMWEQPIELSEINGLFVTRILEAIRKFSPAARFCQASSSEIFGQPESAPQSEETRFRPRSPYGIAKLYGHNMIRLYREHHGLFGCSAILYNHESPIRPRDFVTRKITYSAAQIKLGLCGELQLGDLDARRDWGYAADYMKAMWMMLQHKTAADYVVATGVTHSVRDVCAIAFSHLNLDYNEFVKMDANMNRQPETTQLVGDNRFLRNQLDWEPTMEFEALIRHMVDSDINQLSNNLK